MANDGAIGALLSGLSGGYMAGTQMQRDMAVAKKADANARPTALGVPGGPTQSATGATGLPQTAPALPSSPANKTATDSNGNWQTIANLLNPQSGQQA